MLKGSFFDKSKYVFYRFWYFYFYKSYLFSYFFW